MDGLNLEVTLLDFVKWLREHSHKVGYRNMVYLYSDDGKEAKRLLNRLMFLDCKSEWGWLDAYVEYCPARCFASMAEDYRKIIEDGASRKLEPKDPRGSQYSPIMAYVELALTDMQELIKDERRLYDVLDICQRLATRDSFVMLTGDGYPSEVFANQPEMARFLLDGFVIKVDGEKITFASGKPKKTLPVPYFGLLSCGHEDKSGAVREWKSCECEHLLFQWDLLCTWKDRYKVFDLDLFKDAFVDAWKLLQTKTTSNGYQFRYRLIAMMGGFIGGFFWYFSLMSDLGPSGDGVVYGDPYELEAAVLLADSLLNDAVRNNLNRVGKTIKLRKVIRRDEFDYWKPLLWDWDLTLLNFVEAVDDLANKIRDVKTA